jgi:ubiquinone/menaquinone biosynthesis C-methylase UbiE
MNIGWLAGWYRWIEYAAFGRALERRRFAFLDRAAGAGNILILGEGDGRTLARLLELAPKATFHVVERSDEMIDRAHRRTGYSERVLFVNEDALNVVLPAAHYDAVLTMFFLDCFGEREARGLIQRLERALAPGGVWLVSEFSIPGSGWRRWHARVWIAAMYCFFGLTTGLRARVLPPIGGLLTEAGLERVAIETERSGMIVSEVWARHDRT